VHKQISIASCISLLYHWIIISHHISLSLVGRFIDPINDRNNFVHVAKDLFLLICTVELALYS